MKFYFCEKCGKRVTEVDVEAGAARDKKLNGVYCTDCSVGVLTMEIVPLTERDARQILSKAGEVNTSQKHTVRHQSVRVAAAAGRKPREAGSQVQLAALAGIAAAALIGLALLFAGGGTSRPPTPKGGLPAPVPKVELSPVMQTPAPVPKPVESPAPEPKESVNGTTASTEPQSAIGPEEIRPAEPKTPEAKKEAHPEPAVSATVAPAIRAAQAGPDPKRQAEFWERIFTTLRRRETGGALAAARGTDVLSEVERACLIAALERIQAEDQAVVDALTKKVGENVTLEIGKETVRGKLVSFEPPVLRIDRPIKINGEERGAVALTHTLDQLTEAARKTLLGEKQPETPDEWAGRALGLAAQCMCAEADMALGRCADHSLAPALKRQIEVRRAEERDRQSQTAWEKVEVQAKAAGNQEQAKEVLNALAAFEVTHGSSLWAREKPQQARVADMRHQMETLLLSLDPRIQAMFMGKIVAYEPHTLTLTVEYDFQAKEQLQDFTNADQRNKWARISHGTEWEKGGLRMRWEGPIDVCPRLPQFMLDDITMTYRFNDCKNSNSGSRVGIGFLYKNDKKWDCIFAGIQWDAATRPSKAQIVRSVRVKEKHQFSVLKDASVDPFESAELEVQCKGKSFQLKLNGKVVLEHTADPPNARGEIGLAGNFDMGAFVTFLRVKGRLDPDWLDSKLKKK